MKERLQLIQSRIHGDLDLVVSRMMQDKFETFKCSFGSVGMDVPKVFLPIPGLSPGVDVPQAMIEDSKMVITRYAFFQTGVAMLLTATAAKRCKRSLMTRWIRCAA